MIGKDEDGWVLEDVVEGRRWLEDSVEGMGWFEVGSLLGECFPARIDTYWRTWYAGEGTPETATRRARSSQIAGDNPGLMGASGRVGPSFWT